MSDDQIQQQYPYSVKIEQTAYGARVSVHVYNVYPDAAKLEAVSLYIQTRRELEDHGMKIAPEEPKESPKK